MAKPIAIAASIQPIISLGLLKRAENVVAATSLLAPSKVPIAIFGRRQASSQRLRYRTHENHAADVAPP